MKDTDRIKFERICDTFERNIKVTRLYADYLERYPELITKEMIDALTEDGDLTQEEAIVGLLSELFGLDFDNHDDRIIICDYLSRSVRLLDRKKYENNPY